MYATHDKRWLEQNNYFIEFVPYINKGNFEIHIYRDNDNVFKVLISNSFSKKVTLKYSDLDKLKSNPNHQQHTIAITWGNGENKLYIDGALVDKYPL